VYRDRSDTARCRKREVCGKKIRGTQWPASKGGLNA
jgi:hypothetical protein